MIKRKRKIIKNSAQCKKCGEIIESKYTHDFQGCKCFRESLGKDGIAIDGGLEYFRIIGNPDNFINLSETRLFTDEERDEYNRRAKELREKYKLKMEDME